MSEPITMKVEKASVVVVGDTTDAVLYVKQTLTDEQKAQARENIGVGEESISNAVNEYLKDNPVHAGATAEEAAQIAQNKQDIENLSNEKLDASKLPEVINEALAQAKISGEFDGDDYVLTDVDKQEIAEQAAELVEIPEGGTVTDEQIASAVEDYMAEHPVEVPDGTGLTATAKNLLITILRNGVYSTDQSQNITALAAEVGVTEEEPDIPDVPDEPDEPDVPVVTKYTITNELVNVSSSNAATSVNENASYTATLTADDGYEISNVTVTMGGVDVTASVYANGVISISAVTGNVEIVASAVVEETEPELPTDGLVSYFDFRNSSGLVGDSTNGFKCEDTVGDGCLYSWYAVNGGDEYGVLGIYGTYDRNGGTSATKMGQNLTVCTLSYNASLAKNGFCWNNYVSAGNFTVVLGQKYIDTSGSEKNVGTKYIEGAVGYNAIIMSISPEKMRVYINGELKEEILTSELTDFASWPDTVKVGSGYGQSNGVALAIYEKSLSETEVVDITEYFKTLEVTA